MKWVTAFTILQMSKLRLGDTEQLVQGRSLKQQGQACAQDCLTPEPEHPTPFTLLCEGRLGGGHLA